MRTLLAASLLLAQACDMTDLDINTDPNNPLQAGPDLLLSSVLYSASNTFAGGLNQNAHGFVGILSSADRFDLNNASYNGTWNTLYSGPLKDLDALLKSTDPSVTDSPHYLGVAQILKAYYFSLMTDLWGDVPYTEAFNGNAEAQVKFPKYDAGAEIYASAIALLQAGIENLSKTTPQPIDRDADLIYGGRVALWQKAGRSLLLRLLLQQRRVNDVKGQVEALLADPSQLISSASDNFVFQFGAQGNLNSQLDPTHPWYQSAYRGAENGFSYFSHQFMVEMLDNDDPRVPYYLLRQTSDILDQDNPTDRQTTPCSQVAGCVYGYIVLNPNMTQRLYGKNPDELSDEERDLLAGIFGRDRSDPSGVPLDGSLRTAPATYPAAGLYGEAVSPAGNNRGAGNGVFPMLTTWMVKFYQIEAILTMGVPGDARAVFEEAMTEAIDYVANFSSSISTNAPAASGLTEERDAYVARWLSRYDNAASDGQKLNVVLKQAWFSNFGNGYEIYNAFRRTGYPNDIQTPVSPTPRNFALRLPYAQDDLTLNQNAPQSPPPFDSPDGAVFWDVLKFQS